MILPPNSIHRRGDLNESQWRRLRSLLPAQKPPVGRPSTIIAESSMASCGLSERGHLGETCPNAMGHGETVSGRFYRWRKQGLWQQILQKLQQLADAKGQLDWELHHVDGSVIRAHQHGSGGKEGGDRSPESTLAN